MKFAYFEAKLQIGMGNYCLHYNNKILRPQNVLDTFNACSCCERHQILKPKKLRPWVNTNFMFPDEKQTVYVVAGIYLDLYAEK